MSVINTLALYAIRLIDQLDASNLVTYQLIQNAKLTPRELSNKENLIPQSKYIDLVRQVVAAHDINCLGLRVGQHTGMLEHGIISYAMLSCENLRQSIERFEKYQNLTGPILSIKLSVDGDFAVLSAIPTPHIKWLPNAVIKYFIQEWIGCISQWGKFIDCPDHWFSHIKFSYAPDDDTTDYQEHLNCSYEFNNQITQVFFPRQYLDLPLNFADHETNEICVNQCEKLLKEQQITDELTTQIHRLLFNSPARAPRAEEIAAALFITSRTLHRRLKKENTTYQQIVIQFRLSLAKRYLIETILPISEISLLVGYADHSNFYRTFRRETGVTPQQYRQQTGAAA